MRSTVSFFLTILFWFILDANLSNRYSVYAYFPTNVSGSYDPCGQRKTLICNDAYGTSIGRGSFTFKRGG